MSTSGRSKLSNPLAMTPLKGVSLPSISLPGWKSNKLGGVTAIGIDRLVVGDEKDLVSKD
jgi:hypothetical protein